QRAPSSGRRGRCAGCRLLARPRRARLLHRGRGRILHLRGAHRVRGHPDQGPGNAVARSGAVTPGLRALSLGSIDLHPHQRRLTMETKTSLTRAGGYVPASALLAALLVAGGPANAAEIRLLSAASMQTVFRQIAGEFERASGHRLIIRYSTMGAITDRIMGGEQADLVISSPQSISDLVEEARIDSRNWV